MIHFSRVELQSRPLWADALWIERVICITFYLQIDIFRPRRAIDFFTSLFSSFIEKKKCSLRGHAVALEASQKHVFDSMNKLQSTNR